MKLVTRLGTIALAMAAGVPAHAGDIPKPLDGIVFGASKRSVTPLMVQGSGFDSIASMIGDNPYLLWPNGINDSTDNAIPTDPEEFAAWIGTASDTLGFEGFTPEFTERYQYLEHEIIEFRLMRNGAQLHDAEIRAHVEKDTLIGIVVHLDGRISAIDEMDASIPRAARLYHQVRTEDRSIVARPARKIEENFADRTIRRIVSPTGEVYETEHDLKMVEAPESTYTFIEYPIPGSMFPDQISVADDKRVWLSDPLTDDLIVFDPATTTFTSYPTTGGDGPDGFIVGSNDLGWTGCYYNERLGVMHLPTGQFKSTPVPYSPAAPAIPVETTDGHIWVTDHAYNRISEFSPSAGWVQSIVMPTPACWVVQGYEDYDKNVLYFTEYSANQLGRIKVGGTVVQDIATPGGGPAFCVYFKERVYYSRWLESGIGMLDVNTLQVTEFNFPVQNENGGPLWIRKNGDVVCGTRGQGYIMVFDRVNQTFTALPIPTAFPGLKDGLTVGPDDLIWFTETGVDQLGVLKF